MATGTTIALIDSIVVFIVSLLIGALDIYIGARVIADREDYSCTLITALIGAIIWVVVPFFFGGIPLLGPPLALVAYVAVINYRYLGGCGSAIDIALVVWIASLVVLYILGILGVTAFDAMGVPGT